MERHLDMHKMYGQLAIFSGSAHPALAKEIAGCLGEELRGVDISRFPNENIFVKLHKSVRSHDVFIIQPFSPPVSDNIMELLIMIDTIKRDSAGRITAVIPFYAYGRSDKKDQPRIPLTARLLADMITVAGADRFLTLDLHAGQITGFFTIPGDEMSAFHILRDHFLKKEIENGVVVAPDLGAAKKARNFAQVLDMPLAVIEKRRIGTDTEDLSIIGDVQGKNAIVYDDEIDTAGTLVNAANLLKACGAADIYACATHPTFSPPATERLRAAPLKEIVVTNTVPIPPHKMLPNITILSVGPFLGEIIRRIHEGRSVGELINE